MNERETNAPERLARTTIYENPWVSLYVDRVRFPGGRVIEAHHVLHFDKEAVAAIVEDADSSRVLLVEAYRYVVGSIQWEVPAGSIDPGETAIDAAAREVREESGYATVNHQAVAAFEPINGIGDKVHHLVYCRAVGEPGVRRHAHRGRVVPCSELVREVRGYSLEEHEAREVIRPHVSNLRRKLKASGQNPNIIVNVRGIGYRLAETS